MDNPDALSHYLGSFEPQEAKRILPKLEAEGIPFQIEADHRPLYRGMDFRSLYSEKSKILVYIDEADLPKAFRALADVFPI